MTLTAPKARSTPSDVLEIGARGVEAVLIVDGAAIGRFPANGDQVPQRRGEVEPHHVMIVGGPGYANRG